MPTTRPSRIHKVPESPPSSQVVSSPIPYHPPYERTASTPMASTKRLPVSLEGFRSQTRGSRGPFTCASPRAAECAQAWMNELWDEQVKEFGFLPPVLIVIIAMESGIIYSQHVPLSQSRQFSISIPLKAFSDAEVQKVFDSGKELGFQNGGICSFSADVVAKLDSASPGAQNGPGAHTVSVLRSTALPSTQKTYRKFDLVAMASSLGAVHAQWVQNTVMDDHGHPAPGRIILRRGESAFAQDRKARKHSLGAKQDFAFSPNSFLFTADVVTKPDNF
ncbi:hypothetical protein B0H13DRAFT_2345644 [Mycena leptocephala]|nr:hypothetical protein B0H13DRAFT_2345644 [Mycena leptocephala]